MSYPFFISVSIIGSKVNIRSGKIGMLGRNGSEQSYSNDTYGHILTPGKTEITKRKILTLFFIDIGYCKK